MNLQQNIPASFEVTHELKATKLTRFVNYLIDLIAIYIFIIILAVIVGLVAALFGSDAVLIWMENISDLQANVVFIVASLLYYFLFETFSMRSLGKLITGSKVVMADNGAKPTATTIIKRSFCRLIPFEQFSFLGEFATGWHDSISRTTVVDAKRFNAALSLQISFEELGSNNNESTIY